MAPIATIAQRESVRACLVGLRPLTMRIGFSDEIDSDIARRKEGQWQGDMTGRGHGSHVVARLRPSERRPPRRLSDGERLVVHPVHDEITATANRQGGRPPLTMMVYGPRRPTKRSAAPPHRPFIHQSGCRSISPGSSSESQPEIMSALSLREARADRVFSDLPRHCCNDDPATLRDTYRRYWRQ